MGELLSVAEAAVQLGTNPANVQRWCRQGRFPNAQKIGTGFRATWTIPQSDLLGFERPKRGGKRERKK